MQLQFEFNVEQEIKQQLPFNKIINDTYTESEYHALKVIKQDQQQIKALQSMQTILKTESLLLKYEEKMKNEKVKAITIMYINTFNSFLNGWEFGRQKKVLVLTRKDLLQISEQLHDQLQTLRKCILKINMKDLFTINSKPTEAFLRDFFNFFPNWQQHITKIMEMQINNTTQIQSCFGSEYTFPSKIISSLKLSSAILQFCSEIFQKPLKQIALHHEQLFVEFHNYYEPWLNKINGSVDKPPFNYLEKFINDKIDGRSISKKMKFEIAQLIDCKSFEEPQRLIEQIYRISKNKQQINKLFSEINSEQIDGCDINIKLAVLVQQKIKDNKRKIGQILKTFMEEILKGYSYLPKQIKYILKQFYQIGKQRFNEIKFQDMKAFFNKVIFTQLLLPQFNRMFQSQKTINELVKNGNFRHIALLSQKILYGQQFYEKQKCTYIYFDKLIATYTKQMEKFVTNLIAEIKSGVSIPPQRSRVIFPMLLSMDSVKFIYESMRTANIIRELPEISNNICKQKLFEIGSNKYKRQDLYNVLINKVEQNYEQIFKPKNKIKRIFIEFLSQIDEIPQYTSFEMLLEQYKYGSSRTDNSQIEMNSNYLSVVRKQYNIHELCSNITKDIELMKKQCKLAKKEMEKQYNIAQNMEKIYVNALNEKKKRKSVQQMQKKVDELLKAPINFHYTVTNNKVCELEQQGPSNTFSQCIDDICQYYGNEVEGVNNLYHLTLQKLKETIESSDHGVIRQETMALLIHQANEKIGKMLYEKLKINDLESEKDCKIYKQMVKHKFINLKLLQLPQYSEQQDLILQETLGMLQRLQIPHSANELLRIFNQTTLIFQNIILTTGKAADITADVQIPMMMLILIKSEIRNLATLTQFIEKFASDDIHSTVLGQTLTLIKSVSYLIEEMGAKSLNLPVSEYERLCRVEVERNTSEINRSYLVIDE